MLIYAPNYLSIYARETGLLQFFAQIIVE